MVDLYKILGIKNNATVKTIRNSYRKRAKKAHPDVGGSAEEFAQLKLAHDILTDPVRRLKYDETGDVSEKAPDNSLSQVIGELATALDHVLSQIERRSLEPTEFNIVSDMKIFLGGKLDEIQKKRKDLSRVISKTEKLLGRFGVKSGENYLEGIIVGKLSALSTHLRMVETQETPVKRALDILTNSSFRSDHGGGQSTHNYGSAYKLQDLMNQAWTQF